MCMVVASRSTSARLVIISQTYSPAPYCRHSCRKAVLVIPAIGASTTGGSTVCGPIRRVFADVLMPPLCGTVTSHRQHPGGGYPFTSGRSHGGRTRASSGRQSRRAQERSLRRVCERRRRDPADALASIPKRELLVWENDELRASLFRGLADAAEGKARSLNWITADDEDADDE